jgi:hypothetical protein
MRMLTDKKGLSDVVATVILCGVVLAIGISVWSMTYSITSGLQSDYYEEVKGMMDAVSKRFIIEHVAYVKSAGTLYVWVYNYGKVDIEIIQVVVRGDVEGMNDSFIPVASGGLVRVDVPLVATGGEELSITVMEGDRRQNFVYATYIVPYT